MSFQIGNETVEHVPSTVFYLGKRYRLIRISEKWEKPRALLAWMNGSREFWCDVKLLDLSSPEKMNGNT